MKQHPAGSATAIAIIILGLVSTALTAMTIAANLDHRRTESLAAQTQLRLMLLAGADAVRADAARLNWKPQKWTVEMPAGGSAEGVQVTAETSVTKDNIISVQLIATIGRHHMQERLGLRRDGDHWRVISAELE